jgi:hypothetical protein
VPKQTPFTTTSAYSASSYSDGGAFAKALGKPPGIGPPVGPNDWQLFNLEEDPGETRDLAREQPERLSKLKGLWERYADEVGLVLPDKPSFTAQ